jgi:hypothetical protein
MVTFWWAGLEGNEIAHIVNNLGAASTKAHRQVTLPE